MLPEKKVVAVIANASNSIGLVTDVGKIREQCKIPTCVIDTNCA